MLQMWKLRFGKGKGLPPGPTESQRLDRNSNSDLLTPRAEFTSVVF